MCENGTSRPLSVVRNPWSMPNLPASRPTPGPGYIKFSTGSTMFGSSVNSKMVEPCVLTRA
jgi:hypothetical protein